jgi:hypothetical protein
MYQHLSRFDIACLLWPITWRIQNWNKERKTFYYYYNSEDRTAWGEVRDGRRTPVLCKITNETGATVWRLLSLLISLWDMIFLLRVYKKGSSWRCTRQTQLCISIHCEPLQNSSFLYSPSQNRLSLYVITLQFLTILCHRR